MFWRTLQLSAEQRAELEQVRDRDRRPYLRECAAALLKVAEGQSAHQVAKTGLHKPRAPDTLYRWLDKYQRERPGGYSTVAPRKAEDLARRLSRLNCGYWDRGGAKLLARLGVRYVAVHDGIYADSPVVPDCRAAGRRGLRAHGFRRIAADGQIMLFEKRAPPTALTP
jgi:hypothetical protein